MLRQTALLILIFTLAVCAAKTLAQDTNPVDRKVANPVTDTPNVNPIAPERSVVATQKKQEAGYKSEGGDDEVVVYSERQTVAGEKGSRIIIHEGNVDLRYGIYRLQADKITVYEAENKVVAEGSVVFDQGEDQRITGTRGTFNYKTKLGNFVESTGFTNQTDDGTVIYFTADSVERTGPNEIVVRNGKFTACEEAVPKWSFTADKATIRPNDRVKLKNPKFRVKDIPVLVLPYASLPIERQDRQSGFLTPTFGFSPSKGARISNAYFQTLGRSADVTFRSDIYTGRGLGFGLDVRTRFNSRSYFNFGFYAVRDRIFGTKESVKNPDQGGSIVYAEGVQYFSNGFTAVADVRITSSLDFRQVFSDGIQQVISPIEVSQLYINKSWGNYTLNVLARSQVVSIPNVSIKTRSLPGITFEKRPGVLSFFKDAYFTFKTSVEGVSRREEVANIVAYRQRFGVDPIITPAVSQRFDIHPQFIIPLQTKYFNFTTTVGGRVNFYSDSLNEKRQVVGTNIIRKYGEVEFDIRPVALAKNYYGKNNVFRFRHVIEPFLTYRYVTGVNNFNRIIRYDFEDTATDTNEVEYGITNRIFTRKYTEAVTSEAQKLLQENPETKTKDPLSIQPYEIFTLTVRGKYFFDPTFGDALVTGQRNQIQPITALTFYTFGGLPRKFSPLNIDATYRPRRTIFVNTRMDIGVQNDGLRALSATVGYNTRLVKFFQTFYYTRGVRLLSKYENYADPFTKLEPGTLRGAQFSPSVFLGDRNHGYFGGASLFFDFENRRGINKSPLISSLFTLGYAYDCCSVALQYSTFNVGVRRENRFVFSFKLNGIGTFGTEQLGQGIR